MTALTFTQIVRNKQLFEQAKRQAEARPVKRPKWAFNVLAVVTTPQGTKVEVFDDYTFARKWTAGFGGGSVYPRDTVADYTATSVTLKDGMAVAEPYQDVAEWLLDNPGFDPTGAYNG